MRDKFFNKLTVKEKIKKKFVNKALSLNSKNILLMKKTGI